MRNSKIGYFFIPTFLLLILICIVDTAVGQPLKYDKLNYDLAVAKAKISRQIIFIQLESDCNTCNLVADSGLSGDEIGSLFSKFICIKVEKESADYKSILAKYLIYPELPTSLFIDGKENYLASMNNFSTSNKNEYIRLAARALVAKEDPPFRTYTDALMRNICNKACLKEYIIGLNNLNLNVDSLVGRYMDLLTVGELSNESEIAFFIRTAPLINSRVYNLIRLDNPVYSKVFSGLPPEERLRINQRIIAKSKSKAFREKNRNYLYYVGSYLAGSYGDNHKEGLKASQRLNLEFFKLYKDTTSYFQNAKYYYDQFFRKLNLDSIRSVEMNRIVRRQDGAIIRGGSLYQTGNDLNEIAYSIFELCRDKEQLAFALKISENTLKYNLPEYFDTYARILYRLGGRKDAIDWQKKAISIRDSLMLPGSEYKEALAKMEAGTL
jgi:hypothetical protein